MKSGQAALEYLIALAGMLVVVTILWGLVAVVKNYSERTENLVSSDYP